MSECMCGREGEGYSRGFQGKWHGGEAEYLPRESAWTNPTIVIQIPKPHTAALNRLLNTSSTYSREASDLQEGQKPPSSLWHAALPLFRL